MSTKCNAQKVAADTKISANLDRQELNTLMSVMPKEIPSGTQYTIPGYPDSIAIRNPDGTWYVRDSSGYTWKNVSAGDPTSAIKMVEDSVAKGATSEVMDSIHSVATDEKLAMATPEEIMKIASEANVDEKAVTEAAMSAEAQAEAKTFNVAPEKESVVITQDPADKHLHELLIQKSDLDHEYSVLKSQKDAITGRDTASKQAKNTLDVQMSEIKQQIVHLNPEISKEYDIVKGVKNTSKSFNPEGAKDLTELRMNIKSNQGDANAIKKVIDNSFSLGRESGGDNAITSYIKSMSKEDADKFARELRAVTGEDERYGDKVKDLWYEGAANKIYDAPSLYDKLPKDLQDTVDLARNGKLTAKDYDNIDRAINGANNFATKTGIELGEAKIISVIDSKDINAIRRTLQDEDVVKYLQLSQGNADKTVTRIVNELNDYDLAKQYYQVYINEILKDLPTVMPGDLKNFLQNFSKMKTITPDDINTLGKALSYLDKTRAERIGRTLFGITAGIPAGFGKAIIRHPTVPLVLTTGTLFALWDMYKWGVTLAVPIEVQKSPYDTAEQYTRDGGLLGQMKSFSDAWDKLKYMFYAAKNIPALGAILGPNIDAFDHLASVTNNRLVDMRKQHLLTNPGEGCGGLSGDAASTCALFGRATTDKERITALKEDSMLLFKWKSQDAIDKFLKITCDGLNCSLGEGSIFDTSIDPITGLQKGMLKIYNEVYKKGTGAEGYSMIPKGLIDMFSQWNTLDKAGIDKTFWPGYVKSEGKGGPSDSDVTALNRMSPEEINKAILNNQIPSAAIEKYIAYYAPNGVLDFDKVAASDTLSTANSTQLKAILGDDAYNKGIAAKINSVDIEARPALIQSMIDKGWLYSGTKISDLVPQTDVRTYVNSLKYEDKPAAIQRLKDSGLIYDGDSITDWLKPEEKQTWQAYQNNPKNFDAKVISGNVVWTDQDNKQHSDFAIQGAYAYDPITGKWAIPETIAASDGKWTAKLNRQAYYDWAANPGKISAADFAKDSANYICTYGACQFGISQTEAAKSTGGGGGGGGGGGSKTSTSATPKTSGIYIDTSGTTSGAVSAIVTEDGQVIGSTDTILEVDPGLHTVVVTKTGYKTQTLPITVYSGSIARRSLTMTKSTTSTTTTTTWACKFVDNIGGEAYLSPDHILYAYAKFKVNATLATEALANCNPQPTLSMNYYKQDVIDLINIFNGTTNCEATT